MNLRLVYFLPIVALLVLFPLSGARARNDPSGVLEDFAHHPLNKFPSGWDIRKDRGMGYYKVIAEGDSKFVRAHVPSDSVQIYKRVDWDIREYPCLTWKWRVVDLPPDGNERVPEKNDTAAAVYATWVKKLRWKFPSLKYIWSATLPKGTVFQQKDTWVIVVESGPENLGKWVEEKVNVAEDARRLLSETRSNPSVLAILSDSNSTKSTVTADYDEFRIVKR